MGVSPIVFADEHPLARRVVELVAAGCPITGSLRRETDFNGRLRFLDPRMVQRRRPGRDDPTVSLQALNQSIVKTPSCVSVTSLRAMAPCKIGGPAFGRFDSLSAGFRPPRRWPPPAPVTRPGFVLGVVCARGLSFRD